MEKNYNKGSKDLTIAFILFLICCILSFLDKAQLLGPLVVSAP